MIKICHMTSVHAPEDMRIFKKECVSLAKAGYETYLIQQGDSYEKNGVHIVGIGSPPKNRMSRMLKTTKKVYKAAQKVDAEIYHFHDPELLHYGLKLKKKGKRVIFDNHENTATSIKEKYYIPWILRYVVYVFYSWYERHICNKLDAVIYVSPNFKEYNECLNKNNILLPNYPIVESDSFSFPNPNSNKLIFAGTIVPTWSHHNIIKAIESIDGIEYTLCGSCIDEYLAELKRLPGWKKVNYKGRISHEEVKEEMQSSLIGFALMQPHLNSVGHQGTLGNTKLFEEMMAGLPVISTDFELWKPIVEGNKCGICVDPFNVADIRSAIIHLLENREEAINMGKRGRELIIKQYNWGVEEPVLFELYKRLTME